MLNTFSNPPSAHSSLMPGEYSPPNALPTDQNAGHTAYALSPQDSTPNIVIFGETGIGKSSLLNMIAGDEIAKTSSDAFGCTFKTVPYRVTISGKYYRFWDTAGLNEGELGAVPAEQAVQNLQNLVDNLKDGVNLLVYCFRGTRLRDIVKSNYDLFFDVICSGKVPIIAVVTGLENEELMESWWTANEDELKNYGMSFDGHACITTTRGKKMKTGDWMFEKEYQQSEVAVRELISAHFVLEAWYIGGVRDIVRRVRRIYNEVTSAPNQAVPGRRIFETDQSESGLRGLLRKIWDCLQEIGRL